MPLCAMHRAAMPRNPSTQGHGAHTDRAPSVHKAAFWLVRAHVQTKQGEAYGQRAPSFIELQVNLCQDQSLWLFGARDLF
jgi:hypothetical protein